MNAQSAMRVNWEHGVTFLLACCAVLLTGLAVNDRLRGNKSASAEAASTQISKEAWSRLLSNAKRVGPESAVVKIAEFVDYECPACAAKQGVLDALRATYPNEVAIHYLHFPIDGHRFAERAAQVVECADRQGYFEPMHRTLYENQRALGIISWAELAALAGVPNETNFMGCMADMQPTRIKEGKRLGQDLDLKFTPTILVNGWLLGAVPDHDDFVAMIKRVKSGRSPVEVDF